MSLSQVEKWSEIAKIIIKHRRGNADFWVDDAAKEIAALAQQAHPECTCGNGDKHFSLHQSDCPRTGTEMTEEAQPETSWTVEACLLHPLCFRISSPMATTKIHAQHCALDDVLALANQHSLKQ